MLWPAALRRPLADVHTLKPAEELPDEDVAHAAYDLQHLAGPLLTGPSLVTFRLLCESTLFKELLYVIYANKNCLLKVCAPGRGAPARAPLRRPAARAAPRAAAWPVPPASANQLGVMK